jgi:putrescine transport system substrate-binding protein
MPRFLTLLALAIAPLIVNANEQITVFNWNDYIDPQVLVEFERETGIKVNYKTYSSSEEHDKALASGEPIDVAVSSYEKLPKLIKIGALLPLDDSKLPNRSNVDKGLLAKLVAYDRGNHFAIPYLWGSVGLAVNKPQAEKALGGPVPQSWSLVFDPEQSARLASCGISALNEPGEVLFSAMLYQGRDLGHSSPRQIKRAGEMLNAIRPNLRYIDGERYISDLANGKLCVAIAWVGDALKATKAGQPVEFILPEEGASVFIDTLVIPKTAQNPAAAARFINYLMQPKVAAKISQATNYPNAISASKAFLDPAQQALPGLYPDSATKRRLSFVGELPDQQAPVRDEVWSRFVQGQ